MAHRYYEQDEWKGKTEYEIMKKKAHTKPKQQTESVSIFHINVLIYFLFAQRPKISI